MASAASLLPPKNGLQAVDNVTTFSTASRNVGWFDPDDPYPYTLLTQDEIARRLLASSHLMSCILGDGIRVDSVEWQPNPTAFEPKEDRAVVRDFAWRGGKATLLCVFDGHIGVELVEHTAEALPSALIASLQNLPDVAPPSAVSMLLAREIEAFDDALLQAVVDVFPEEELARMTAEQVAERIKQEGVEHKLTLASRGTTALICLISPDKRALWTANVGDCQALLATRSSPAKPWVSVLSPIQHLTSPHGASSPAEVARLQAAHPAEAETVVSNGRVLGQIAVSRALGDGQWKMAPIYVEKLFVRHGPARIQAKLDRLLPMYLTPPYLSASPAVVFTALPPTPAANDDDDDLGRARGPTVLLFLCSDGLKDLYDHRAFPSKTLEDEWIRRAGDACHPAAEGNAALGVLDDAIGAEGDLHRRSASLTVRLPDGGKFADDTTVIVASW